MSEVSGQDSSPENEQPGVLPFKRPHHIAGGILDRRHNASFGFLRLATLDSASPNVRYAYDLRFHPEATDLSHELIAVIGALEPDELGQLSALLRWNDIQGIFGQTELEGSNELGLVVTAQYDVLPDYAVPDEEWCDRYGRPIKVIRELSDEYEAVRDYEAMVEGVVAEAIGRFMPEETPEMQAYFRGWREATAELTIQDERMHSVLRAMGPFYGFGLGSTPDA